ncbi:MAG: S-layer homology domain-containing protein [Bacillota bacterium]|nr:S-layer homology domain-containing protein [Bacillota bacterium]
MALVIMSLVIVSNDTKAADFSDTGTHWAKYSIDYVVEKEYFNGVSNTAFAPNSGATRAMFVTVLARHSGENLTNYEVTHFLDVEDGAYYGAPVSWAFSNGISDGTSNSYFSPDGFLTREQACTMVARYCQQYGIAITEKNAKQTYKDDSLISSWARESVYAMQKVGLMVGSNNMFSPQDNISRAEVAVLLARIDGNFFGNYQKETTPPAPVNHKIGALIDTFKTTFYCPGTCCNGQWGGQTALGVVPTPGRTIAVDPTVIPLGTWVYVDYTDSRLDRYDGVYRAEDTGGAIKGNRIDTLLATHSECMNAGVGSCNIYYYNK